MQRNLVICMVPTVLAFFAIYWIKRRKKPKPMDDLSSNSAQQEETKSVLECASSSDLDNTLSDASSFASPKSSEKSSETDSPLFDSPLHVVDRRAHCDLILPNCIENSYASENKGILRIEDLTSTILADPKQPFRLDSSKDSEALYKTSQSPGPIDRTADFFESDDLFLSDTKEDDHTSNKIVELEIENNNPENCFQKKVVNLENFDNLATLVSAESEKLIETDCHSSAYDENSLSYVSDDSDGKQFVDSKNKGSLSSVLDENSLLSSFCDELEKSSASNSPVAVMPNHFGNECSDSAKDVLDSLSFKESSINIKNYTDSYHSKVSNLEKLIKESSGHVNDSSCLDQPQSYQNDLSSETSSKSNLKDLDIDQLGMVSFTPEEHDETVNISSGDLVQNALSGIKSSGDLVQNNLSDIKSSSDLVQNNLSGIKSSDDLVQSNLSGIESSGDLVQSNVSDIKESSPTSNDKLHSDSRTLNRAAALENKVEQLSHSDGTEAYSGIACHSAENGDSKMSSFSASKTVVSSVTYASILNSNRNTNSSSDAANSVVRRVSSEFISSTNYNDSVNELFKSNLNWPLPNSKSVSESSSENTTNLCSSSSNQIFSSMGNEILPSKRYCEIKTNSDSTAANKDSTSSHLKDSLFESSSEEGHKITKQCKLESNGFFDQKNLVSQSSKEFVYEFELPQELCGRLIGKHGRNVKSIMEHSNANVFIKHHPYDPLLKVVVVEGHRADVNEALEIIRRKYPPSMFPAVTLVQTNVLSSTGVPMPESLQLHLPEGASCDVILSSLVSAGHFFLQQPTHPTYPSLSTLDQCMINLYSQVDTPLLPQPIEAGVICAAPVYRGWYRAQVVYVCDNSSDCGIKFVDYGGFSQVPISSLRQIRSDFMSLPFQASECYLAQVRPLGGDTWSSEATSVFEELAQGQILQALLVEYADDGIPCVYLYRVQGVSSTFINKELVERGLAEWVGNSTHWDPH